MISEKSKMLCFCSEVNFGSDTEVREQTDGKDTN